MHYAAPVPKNQYFYGAPTLGYAPKNVKKMSESIKFSKHYGFRMALWHYGTTLVQALIGTERGAHISLW